MDIDELTQEQISSLTPEQIVILESEPERVDEFLAEQTAKTAKSDKSEQEGQDSAANGADEGEAEPVVLNKSGKGVIPYTEHKALRVDNADLREQLREANARLEAVEKLESLKQDKADAATPEELAEAEASLAAHLATIQDDFPEMHQVINHVQTENKRLHAEVAEIKAQLRETREREERMQHATLQEQITEAKEDRPILLEWEKEDGEMWHEAVKQDQILMESEKWAKKPVAERFDEVIRRMSLIYPDASGTKKQTAAEATRERAKARLNEAPARTPITLSDMQGGADPVSEREQAENMNPFDLANRLMKMPDQKAAAMRADLD